MHIYLHMPTKLTARFLVSLKLVPASLRDVEHAVGRAYRTLQGYRRKEFEVPPEVARRLATYLRQRAKAFQGAAEKLEQAADKETERR